MDQRFQGKPFFGEDEDFNTQKALERIKEIGDKANIVKHNDQLATALISSMVVFFQNMLYALGNRSLGPMIANIRVVCPLILNPEDVLATAILKKYNK